MDCQLVVPSMRRNLKNKINVANVQQNFDHLGCPEKTFKRCLLCQRPIMKLFIQNKRCQIDSTFSRLAKHAQGNKLTAAHPHPWKRATKKKLSEMSGDKEGIEILMSCCNRVWDSQLGQITSQVFLKLYFVTQTSTNLSSVRPPKTP